MNDETTEEIPTEDTPEPTLSDVMKAIADFKKETNIQLEAIRQGLVSNDARFDQLEALALEAKSIALQNRSQLTILTERMRQSVV